MIAQALQISLPIRTPSDSSSRPDEPALLHPLAQGIAKHRPLCLRWGHPKQTGSSCTWLHTCIAPMTHSSSSTPPATEISEEGRGGGKGGAGRAGGSVDLACQAAQWWPACAF